jgi:acyl carrier protein phosphodiesterase
VNWLAHTFLSAPDAHFQLGNLLADLVRGDDRAAMNTQFQQGAACHKAIDAYTDAHPVVRRSRMRIGVEQRRFSGVFMDVFYDHLLAKHWDRYSMQSLPQFTAEFYASVRAQPLQLPAGAQTTLHRIMQFDSLGSYRDIHGVERALRRISAYLTSRWHKPFALERSIPILQAHEAALSADFEEFFPQLQSHVAAWVVEHS